ncbi:leucine rich repeat protein [Leptospira sp. Fiocruz LV3954]|nr:MULTISPECIES: leucine-rich repeat domain-containing protein [unclassified Leptospira]EKO76623.1 leucine rich repeat protein [Leptospira sp. Fiocruz LV3954]EMI65998.1 leucine rich repeat protein [Leptospira sp. Fiocruz LV4135]
MNPHSIVKIISLCFFWIPICSVCKIREEKGTYKNLEEALRNPDKVFVLKMKGTERKKLVTLSREIVRFQNLKELDLEGNQLKEFPKEIGNLQNLKLLHLNGNLLETLPKENRKIIWLLFTSRALLLFSISLIDSFETGS